MFVGGSLSSLSFSFSWSLHSVPFLSRLCFPHPSCLPGYLTYSTSLVFHSVSLCTQLVQLLHPSQLKSSIPHSSTCLTLSFGIYPMSFYQP